MMPDINGLKQRIKELAGKGREILSRNENKPSPEDLAEHGRVMDEIRNLGTQVEAEERQLAAEAAAMVTDPKPVAEDGTRSGEPGAEGRKMQGTPKPPAAQGEQREVGEVIGRAVQLYRGVLRDNEVLPEERAFAMGVGSTGGVMVPDQFVDTILALAPESELVLPRVTLRFPADPQQPDAAVDIPALKQGAAGALGGVTVQWTAEGGAKQETDAELDDIRLEPKEVAGFIEITDKMLRNSATLYTWIQKMLPLAIQQGRDVAYLKGNGVGKPKGIFVSTARILVARAGAGLIGWADTLNMLAALLPESFGSAVWVAHQTTLPQICQIKDAAGNAIFMAGDATKGIPPSLMGIPLVWTGKTYPLGTTGDLALIDFSKYAVKDGYGPQVASSPHVKFKENRTIVKAFYNTDGQLWCKSALTLDDGVTQVSPVVVLK